MPISDLQSGIMDSKPRKYWGDEKSSSFVTTLPRSWVINYSGNYKLKKKTIKTSQIGKTLLITPDEKTPDQKMLSIEVLGSQTSKSYYSIISAYLQNYDEICLREKTHDPLLQENIKKLESKLPGAYLKPPEVEGEYKILFKTDTENIPHILDEMYEHYTKLYEKNKELFKGLGNAENIKTKYDFVKSREIEVDRRGFLLKRLFTRVFEKLLYNPSILEETGLAGNKTEPDYSVVAKSVSYSVIGNNLERLSDIQVNIFKLLRKIVIDKKKNRLLVTKQGYSFENYYDGAHKMIRDAYKSKEVVEQKFKLRRDFECLLRILSSEDQEENGVCYRGEYIKGGDRKDLLDLTRKSRTLTLLEDAIWANTGIATNIAEACINMSNLAEINKTSA